MSYVSKMELVERLRPRYRRSGRERKKRILDEFCEITGHDRKHAIKLLNGRTGCRRRRPGRKKSYTEEVVEPLKEIWMWTDQLCSKLLKEALPEWIGFYQKRFGALDAQVRRKLLKVSPAQIDRPLAPYRVKTERWRRRGPKPGTVIRAKVPIRTGPWEEGVPGYLEADTVAHCGGSMAGDFIWSITYTDSLSGWTCNRASWYCGRHGVLEQTRDMEERLPFELLGYERLEDPPLVDLLNDLYRTAWEPFHNFFRPCVKPVSKERIGSRYRKKYDRPRTPYQRLMECGHLTRRQCRELKAMKERLNPFELKDAIEEKLQRIFGLISRAA